MRFRYDAEHDELREGLRRYLDRVAGPEGVHRFQAGAARQVRGYDDVTVGRLSDEFGVFAVVVPERFGGAGFGVTELGIVFHEAGRALLCAPLLSTTLATVLLLESGDDEVCARLLPAIAAGEVRLAAAVAEEDVPWPVSPATAAVRDGNSWSITGTKVCVVDALAAEHLVVSARADGHQALFLVERGATGLALDATPIIDLSRHAAAVRFDAVPATRVGDSGVAALARTHDVMLTLVAAELTGIAERCLESATAWAHEREQFGRPIGAFQAVQHKLADVRLELEAATSASMYASWAADHARGELAVSARVAAVTCGGAAMLAAQENIQVHGGIGATWEHPAHFYLRRAVTDTTLFGPDQDHLEQIAAMLESA